ncbi:MAG TPA: YoaK family protein [Verrucomicrobiae bacterium]|nr:YoaK family protein [Verrucomicrobiae bacterium]
MLRQFAIAVVLAWVAGFVDVVGYLALCQVFVAHMSGNTVGAAARLATGQWAELWRRVFPIPVFVLGVFSGALAARIAQGGGIRSRFAPSFILEALLLAAFAVLTRHWILPVVVPGPHLYLLIALLAMAMGLQSATLRRTRELSVRTTFITGILVSMAEKAAAYVALKFDRVPRNRSRCHHEGRQALKYGLLWSGMCIGGICGGWLAVAHGTLALLIPIAVLAVVAWQDLVRPISEK